MFPPEVYGVGVTVERVLPAPWEEEVVLPAGVVSRPSRLGELLPVESMTHQQKAAQLQRVLEAEAGRLQGGTGGRAGRGSAGDGGPPARAGRGGVGAVGRR